MLDILRQGAQSWGIKIVFGIIIAVFVLAFGMSPSGTDSTTVVATVNDAPILIRDFQETLQRNLDTARRQNPGLTSEFLAQIRFKDQILNQMVTRELLLQKATALGLVVSKEELAKEIHLIPTFQNDSNIFDPEKYQTVLKSNRLTPGQFESDFMRNLIMDKIQNYLALPGRVSEDQARDYYDYGRGTTTVSYLLYPWKAHEHEVNATDEKIQEYYTAHKTQYTVPATAKVAFVELSPRSLANQEAVPDEEIAAYYAKHKENYKIEEQVNARHILIRLDENATQAEEEKATAKMAAVQAELTAGKKFEDVAAAFTEDPSGTSTGGALGWFGRGRMVKPFEDAAFATAKGEVCGPIRTAFGFHLIKVEDTKTTGYTPMDAVKAEIKETIAQDRATEILQDTIDQALELVLTGSDLQAVAQSLGQGLKVHESELFTKTNAPSELAALKPEDLAALFDLAVNATTQDPIPLAEGYILATKIENTPATTKPLDTVKDEIKAIVIRDEAAKRAKIAADAALESLRANGNLPSGQAPDLTITESFGRQGSIPGLGMVPAVVDAAFNATADSWLPSSYKVEDGFIVAKASGVVPPSAEDWAKEKELWIQSLNQRTEEQMIQTFLADLRSKADVRILNPEVLEN
ncbi:MAG: hypothetical protein EOL86_01985 [Deltaproteobacteria bacterium]|nr:hypothetical protein [Deltaproteobacteria bacterium]